MQNICKNNTLKIRDKSVHQPIRIPIAGGEPDLSRDLIPSLRSDSSKA
jgi:hypothetical protein